MTHQWNGLPPNPEESGLHSIRLKDYGQTLVSWDNKSRNYFDLYEQVEREPRDLKLEGWEYMGEIILPTTPPELTPIQRKDV